MVTAAQLPDAHRHTVEYPQSVADYHARSHTVLEPEIAASIQESVCVGQWTEHAPDAQPVANILLRVWPQERFPQLRARDERLAAQAVVDSRHNGLDGRSTGNGRQDRGTAKRA